MTALEVEAAQLQKQAVVGGALDLFKCFDQIRRLLMYFILALAGLPPKVLTAYIGFQEHAKIYNSIAGALGTAHQHPCGIPQGCPLSMVFVSLLLRAWLVQMERLQTFPRTLADDVLLMTKGTRALNQFHHAFAITIQHLQDLGGRIAPNKSLTFATHAKHRHWLGGFVWPQLGGVIDVVHSFRDLGSQLTLVNAVSTKVSRDRFKAATSTLERISRLPHSQQQKTIFTA
eukprot:8798217-Karenia_brevis.AAC.1